MSTAADAECLKLVRDRSGAIWYMNGESSPVSTGHRYADFVRTSVLRKARHVRLIGSAENADLVTDLWLRRVRGNLTSVQLCSPAVADGRTVLDDPQTALYAMRAYGNVPSLGGWRAMEAADLTTFRLIAGRKFDRAALALHPVYRPLTFVLGLDETALFDLVVAVVDPRWYVDPAEPDSAARLTDRLGVSHGNYLKLQRHQLPASDQERLAGRVRDAWISGRKMDAGAPGAFVVRAGACIKGTAERELFSSLTFVAYLRAVWLNALDGTHKGRLFSPEHYFSSAAVADAYRAHTGLVGPALR